MNDLLKRHRPEIVVLVVLITLIAAATLSSSQEQDSHLLDLSSPIAIVNGVEIPYHSSTTCWKPASDLKRCRIW